MPIIYDCTITGTVIILEAAILVERTAVGVRFIGPLDEVFLDPIGVFDFLSLGFEIRGAALGPALMGDEPGELVVGFVVCLGGCLATVVFMGTLLLDAYRLIHCNNSRLS